MNKIILCGYRKWAIKVFESIKMHPNVTILDIICSHQEYQIKENNFNESIDIIVFVGWSWIIPQKTIKKILCLGVHPSILPYFKGGSPIQNQIIRGIEKTKVTLFTLSPEKLDAGDIWLQEDLDLSGDNMKEIFNNLAHITAKLLYSFFDKFPDIAPQQQDPTVDSYFKRRKPEESELTKEQLFNMSLKQLYNFIRALTDPYPNAYIKDEEGNKLYFKKVKYIPSNHTIKD